MSLVPIGPFRRVPISGGGKRFASDFPIMMPNIPAELWLDSRDFDGLAQNTRIGELGVTPWVDKSGQTQGGARDGIQSTLARRPWLQVSGSGFEAPNGMPSVKFISQTGTPISPNPVNRLESSNPTGAGSPWADEASGNTFLFLGRIYNMGTASILWNDLTDIRCSFTSRGGTNLTDPYPTLRSAGNFQQLNTGTIFATNPLPWGLTVLRLQPPPSTANTIELFRIAASTGRVDYVPSAGVLWDTTNCVGWALSANLSLNVAQNMDLGTVLWYNQALTDAQVYQLFAWSLQYFGGE